MYKKGGCMKNKKIFPLSSFLMFLFVNAFCFEPVATCDLLLSYIENDNSIKENAINLQKASLSLDSAKINNGFDITLSTGNFIIKLDEENSNISLKPTVEAKIPQVSNLSLSASSNLVSEKNDFVANDTKLSLSVDLISSSNMERQITLLKAQRTLEEAQRKLKNQAVICEKSFYMELKSILNAIDSIISLQKTLYTNKIDFQTIKTQGYSTSSSTYRLAQMKILSTEHEIEDAVHSLIHSYIVFYKKCGYDISTLAQNIDANFDFYTLIPQDITEVEPIDIHNFSEDLYTEVESSLWTYKINSMQRKSQSNFSLAANGGFTLNNSTTGSTTIDAGLSSTIGGLTLGAGVSVPFSQNTASPAVTFIASLSPNKYKLNSITKQTNNLTEQEELLAIENARENFETAVVEYEQTLNNLRWTKQSGEESYEMYKNLELDLEKWYKEGFVTESEYYSAKVNAQSYYVKNIINTIEFIIYNDNIVTMFVEEK